MYECTTTKYLVHKNVITEKCSILNETNERNNQPQKIFVLKIHTHTLRFISIKGIEQTNKKPDCWWKSQSQVLFSFNLIDKTNRHFIACWHDLFSSFIRNFLYNIILI